MKKAILMFAVFFVVVIAVLALTNALQTWDLDSDSTGEISEEFFGITLMNGFKSEDKTNDLSSTMYGGAYTMKLNITNMTSVEDQLKDSYQKLGSTDFPADEDAYQQISDLLGIDKKVIKSAYHQKGTLKRDLYAFTKPDHADIWVIFTQEDTDSYMYLAYSEDACELAVDEDTEEDK